MLDGWVIIIHLDGSPGLHLTPCTAYAKIYYNNNMTLNRGFACLIFFFYLVLRYVTNVSSLKPHIAVT